MYFYASILQGRKEGVMKPSFVFFIVIYVNFFYGVRNIPFGGLMSSSSIQMLISMILYIAVVLFIGVYFAKRANANSENYYIGGRSLGPWVAAFSAEASDMSGWLLMGLPGLAYWTGLADAFWTALGLLIGTYINWLFVAKRLRRYSHVANNSITIPDFFSNRYHEKKKVIMMISSLLILIFFCVYASSCFVTCGKLFSAMFGFNYHSMMIVGVILVLTYTFIGGFLAESASDFMQAIVMVFALVVILVFGTINAGGLGAVFENLNSIPGFLEFFSLGNPALDETGHQIVENGMPLFSEAAPYSALSALSMLAWGLGYFGVPQVLLRFMAIRKADELTKSRRIGTIWVLISLATSVTIGLIGRTLYPTALTTASESENIFSLLASSMLHPLFAGLVMAGIFAATISSSDSYLLIAASAVAKNIYQGIFKKDAKDRDVMRVSRVTLILIALFGAIIALDEESVIFTIVSFAWAGFGAAFGPLMLFSLFWKRTTREGAIAGMVSGAAVVFIWNLFIKPLGGIFAIYELLPAFIISSLVIVIVSLLTPDVSDEIKEEFEKAKNFEC